MGAHCEDAQHHAPAMLGVVLIGCCAAHVALGRSGPRHRDALNAHAATPSWQVHRWRRFPGATRRAAWRVSTAKRSPKRKKPGRWTGLPMQRWRESRLAVKRAAYQLKRGPTDHSLLPSPSIRMSPLMPQFWFNFTWRQGGRRSRYRRRCHASWSSLRNQPVRRLRSAHRRRYADRLQRCSRRS